MAVFTSSTKFVAAQTSTPPAIEDIAVCEAAALDLYGSIVSTDLFGNDNVYYRSRADYQNKGPGDWLGIRPWRVIEAATNFSIVAHVWNKNVIYSESPVGYGRVEWEPENRSSELNAIKVIDLDADNGLAMMRYLVMSNAVSARVEVHLPKTTCKEGCSLVGGMRLKTKYL
ncbi:hypothetical protein XA68_16750 [Ophiocordyceps unilateralis]|uniref:Uncharacterized protein n=1 Tax=Ophiocordyceps unilateralis TaxID=268505 RepID=A0A2A9P624_OPHUN|nr:hypothetical protein XA68_16750 [Ophiocordyceps unilateralis]